MNIKPVELPINWNTDKIVSYSQFTTFRGCPFKWAKMYIDRIKDHTPNIHFVFGNAIHSATQYFYSAALAGTPITDKEIATQFYNKFTKDPSYAVIDTGESTRFLTNGMSALSYLVKSFPFVDAGRYKNLGTEFKIMFCPDESRPNIKFTGMLDFVVYDTHDDKYIIVDLKTATKEWSSWQLNDPLKMGQILFYKHAMNVVYGIPPEKIISKYIVVNITNPHEVQIIDSDNPQLQQDIVSDFMRFLDEAFDSEGNYRINVPFPAYADNFCSNCHLSKYHCPPESRILSR